MRLCPRNLDGQARLSLDVYENISAPQLQNRFIHLGFHYHCLGNCHYPFQHLSVPTHKKSVAGSCDPRTLWKSQSLLHRQRNPEYYERHRHPLHAHSSGMEIASLTYTSRDPDLHVLMRWIVSPVPLSTSLSADHHV
jgi:hypothetical protein